MKSYKELLWTSFERTGLVYQYLKFKLFEEEKTKMEVGEEIGFDKNHGNCFEDNQVR